MPILDWVDDEFFFERRERPRVASIARILIGIPYLLISIFVITPVALLAISLVGLVDLVVALLLNRNVAGQRGSLAWRIHVTAGELYTWNLGNLRWVVYGGSLGFQPLPYGIWRP